MKFVLCIIIFLFCYSANSQSLSVFDIDTTNFPTMRAKFYAFDANGNQVLNLSPYDFEIKENGQPRTVLNVSCPTPKPLQNVSIAMSIDVSGSMSYSDIGNIPVELGKTTATELCKLIAMPPSEFALQTCHKQAFIIQDFTTDKSKILYVINPIKASGDNDFVEQLLNPRTGLLNIAKRGKNKRIAVLYTDAWWYPLSANEFQQCKDICQNYKIEFYAIIYNRPESEPNGIKKSLRELAESTGGCFYDGITEEKAAIEIANGIQVSTQGVESCSIEWQSGVSCIATLTNLDVKLLKTGALTNTSYQSPNNSVAKLEFNPPSVKFKNAIKDTCIILTVKARNANFTVSNITASNPSYRINPPTSFSLKAEESRNLTVCYTPSDSGYTYCKFTIENDLCPTKYYASGGFTGKRAKVRTLKLIKPNGGEEFVVGMDTVITWEGVLPEEKVKIEYSTNNGINWIPITDSAKGLSYNWHVPNTPSNKCLARVTAKVVYETIYPEIQICNQVWMGCNLDVDTYRNGEPIPEVTDFNDWSNLKTGAWCYYNNDPMMGIIYGKLYNWYAVIDPRGLAPKGWHIPSDSEWKELSNCLGGELIAGGKLKSTGTKELGDGIWWYPNTGATDESGFSALPGGLCSYNGFFNLEMRGHWWSSTEYYGMYSWNRNLYYDSEELIRNYSGKEYPISVRCIKD
jgi:uncharacterized protein (TIGR02145 family)